MRTGLLLALLALGVSGFAATAADKTPPPEDRDRSRLYSPPHKPAVPLVRNQDRVENPIDAFVLEKLEAKRLSPSPAADSLTLLRRVTFDLTGLMPTIAEQDAFLADHSPEAYRHVVDRLLESPHYG